MVWKMKRVLLTVFLAGCIMLSFPTPVYACRMFIEPVEPGVVRIMHDGNRPSTIAEVVVYDEEKRELARGKVDEQGYFRYSPDIVATFLVAEDGKGHRAEWRVGDPVEVGRPRITTGLAVVLGFVAIAGFFHLRNKRKVFTTPK